MAMPGNHAHRRGTDADLLIRSPQQRRRARDPPIADQRQDLGTYDATVGATCAIVVRLKRSLMNG
jgi:hypothetical protein